MIDEDSLADFEDALALGLLEDDKKITEVPIDQKDVQVFLTHCAFMCVCVCCTFLTYSKACQSKLNLLAGWTCREEHLRDERILEDTATSTRVLVVKAQAL